MATLDDDKFLAEVDALIRGKPNELMKIEETPPAKTAEEIAAETAAAAAPPQKTAEELAAEAAAAKPADEPAKNEPAADDPAPQVDDPSKKKDEGQPAQEPAKTAEQIAAEQAAAAANTNNEPDYKAIHARIFGGPIRAAGKDITIANVDEAISLIQKGVGFHTKMNKVQQDVAIAETLRNAGIDQATLNVLIDAHQKKPGAIKKLLDSAKLDPLTLDSAEASTYAPSDHRVSEAQVRFQSVVSDLTETDAGTAVLQDANGWDQASKAEIFKTPDMLSILAHQKESGRYDKIKAQVDRDRLIGNIPPNESFLTSYARVGQQMMQAGAFGAVTPPSTPTPAPVIQKVVTPPTPPNPKQVAAAAPTRTTPAAKTVEADPAKDMGDEEFTQFMRKTFKV